MNLGFFLSYCILKNKVKTGKRNDFLIKISDPKRDPFSNDINAAMGCCYINYIIEVTRFASGLLWNPPCLSGS